MRILLPNLPNTEQPISLKDRQNLAYEAIKLLENTATFVPLPKDNIDALLAVISTNPNSVINRLKELAGAIWQQIIESTDYDSCFNLCLIYIGSTRKTQGLISYILTTTDELDMSKSFCKLAA